jgi:hypothetical protein
MVVNQHRKGNDVKQITQSYDVAGDQVFVADRLCCDPNCLETSANVAPRNICEESRGQATSKRNLGLIFRGYTKEHSNTAFA